MEQTPTTGQINCQWCSKPMNSDATRCSGCGKLRKDIYTGKMRTYVFCITGGLFIGLAISLWNGSNANAYQYYNYYNAGTADGSNTTNYILLALGIIGAAIGIYYYIKVSQQLKTYWWS